MAKAEKDVFSVYESVEATPFGVAFYLSKSQVQKTIHRAELKMHLSLLFLIPNLELSKKVRIFVV